MRSDIAFLEFNMDSDIYYSDLVNYICDRQGVVRSPTIVQKLLSMHLSRQYITTKLLRRRGINITLTKARRFITSCRDIFIMNEIPIGYNEIKDPKMAPTIVEGKAILPRKSSPITVSLSAKDTIPIKEQEKIINKIENSDGFKFNVYGKSDTYYLGDEANVIPDNKFKFTIKFNADIDVIEAYDIYCSIILLYKNRWRKKYKTMDLITFVGYIISGEKTRNHHIINFLRELTGYPYLGYKKMKIIKLFDEMKNFKGLKKNTLDFQNFVEIKKRDGGKKSKLQSKMEKIVADLDKSTKELVSIRRTKKKYKKECRRSEPSDKMNYEKVCKEESEKQAEVDLETNRLKVNRDKLEVLSKRSYSSHIKNYSYLLLREMKTKSKDFYKVHNSLKKTEYELKKGPYRVKKRKGEFSQLPNKKQDRTVKEFFDNVKFKEDEKRKKKKAEVDAKIVRKLKPLAKRLKTKLTRFKDTEDSSYVAEIKDVINKIIKIADLDIGEVNNSEVTKNYTKIENKHIKIINLCEGYEYNEIIEVDENLNTIFKGEHLYDKYMESVRSIDFKEFDDIVRSVSE